METRVGTDKSRDRQTDKETIVVISEGVVAGRENMGWVECAREEDTLTWRRVLGMGVCF